jgi:hypothetical protein
MTALPIVRSVRAAMLRACPSLAARAMGLAVVFALASATSALAQVPVIDNANLAQSRETARNTGEIRQSTGQILDTVQKTLRAVSGDRSSDAQGQLSQIALGQGFNLGQAPSLGNVLSGGGLGLNGLSPDAQRTVSTLINGLQLVNSISGLMNGRRTTSDQSYLSGVNTAATLSGLIAATQSAAQSRTGAFTAAGASLGAARDIKGSIDQNTQVQVQTGQTVNELIGVMNNVVTAQNVQVLQRLAAESATSQVMTYDASRSPFGNDGGRRDPFSPGGGALIARR